MAHMFYANMGGFVLLYRRKPVTSPAVSEKRDAQPASARIEEAIKNDQGTDKEDPISSYSRDEFARYYLTASVLRKSIEEGLLPTKAVPEDEISDRSKSDWFAKLLVVLQLVDFFVGVIARVAEGLPVPPLEVAVSAFAVCSIDTCAFLFKKPKDVATTITLATYDEIPKRL